MLNKTGKYEEKIRQLERKLGSIESAVDELTVLNEIAVAAGKTIGIDQTLNIILNKTIKALNAEYGAVLLVSENRDILKTFIKHEENSKLRKSPGLQEHVTGWILTNKKSLIIKDLSSDKRFKTSKEERENLYSLVSSPIWFEGKIIGVLQLINKKSGRTESFTDNDLTLLSIISVQAGQLIKNSELQNLNYEKKKEAEVARLESEKLHELDELKTNFFTNISHEFRTPLTLILGPVEQLIEKYKYEDDKSNLIMIRKNAQKLLELINQILELSKLDAGKLKLRAEKGNIVSFVKGIAMSFESLAERKNIKLKIIEEADNIELYFDRDKTAKILTNLISNAFKFTDEEGEIIISMELSPSIKEKISLPEQEFENESIKIKIKDTGIGIPGEQLPRLFDRFYQADNSQSRMKGEHSAYGGDGSGIGLALTKELVELHHGSIHVISKVGKGSEFIVELPLGKKHLKENQIIKESQPQTDMNIKEKEFSDLSTQLNEDLGLSSKEKIIILVVEDNHDVRQYIKNIIGDNYLVEEAINGKQGVTKAQKIIPDLIISDIMMPEMDGNELTIAIKNDERTSHIPVILLTAKSEIESKIEGLETGADDYLVKPFDSNELMVRIKNLIDLRKKLHEKYSKIDFFGPKHKNKLSTPDEKFIKRVTEVVENHLSEEGFSIEEFNNELDMGSVQTYRKLKALTGKSPSRYIRTIRLIKARKMIAEKQGTISEIAFSVGFSTPQYFTKCFKEEFNYPPSELIK